MADTQQTTQRVHHHKGKKWGKPFQKGVAANPGGRPKHIKNAIEASREHAPVAMKTLAEVAKNPNVSAAARVTACIYILDRAYGRPPQLQTNVNLEYKRAIDMSDQELEAIIAGALDKVGGSIDALALPSPMGDDRPVDATCVQHDLEKPDTSST